MRRIAILDKDPADRAELVALISGYFEGKADRYETEFTDPDCDISDFDMFFVKPELGGRSGMDFAITVSKQGKNAPIVFVSHTEDFVIESYNAKPLHYLLFPINAAQFSGVMERAVTKIGDEKRIIFCDKKDILIFAPSEIEYVEETQTGVTLATKRGKYSLSCQIEDYAQKLKRAGFRSQAVNGACSGQSAQRWVMNFRVPEGRRWQDAITSAGTTYDTAPENSPSFP